METSSSTAAYVQGTAWPPPAPPVLQTLSEANELVLFIQKRVANLVMAEEDTSRS